MSIYQDAAGDWIYWDGETKRHFNTYKEAAMAQRDDEYVAKVRAANEAVWEGINKLLALQRQWTALDYGNTLQVTGYTPAQVGAVVFDTANALKATLDAGHATNMANLL